jgi:hypothetical protein
MPERGCLRYDCRSLLDDLYQPRTFRPIVRYCLRAALAEAITHTNSWKLIWHEDAHERGACAPARQAGALERRLSHTGVAAMINMSVLI